MSRLAPSVDSQLPLRVSLVIHVDGAALLRLHRTFRLRVASSSHPLSCIPFAPCCSLPLACPYKVPRMTRLIRFAPCALGPAETRTSFRPALLSHRFSSGGLYERAKQHVSRTYNYADYRVGEEGRGQGRPALRERSLQEDAAAPHLLPSSDEIRPVRPAAVVRKSATRDARKKRSRGSAA